MCQPAAENLFSQWWGAPRTQFEMPGFSVWSDTEREWVYTQSCSHFSASNSYTLSFLSYQVGYSFTPGSSEACEDKVLWRGTQYRNVFSKNLRQAGCESHAGRGECKAPLSNNCTMSLKSGSLGPHLKRMGICRIAPFFHRHSSGT